MAIPPFRFGLHAGANRNHRTLRDPSGETSALSSRRRPAFHPREPSLVTTNLLTSACRNDTHHPFGSQASGGNDPPALGFASRPCDRFAFIEDEEAAGLSGCGNPAARTSSSTCDAAEKLLHPGRLAAGPLEADALAFRLYMHPRSDFSFVKSANRERAQ